jgi:hypothetical protein
MGTTDQERSLVIGVMVMVCLGLAVSLLFSWIIVHLAGWEALYMTKAGRQSAMMSLVFTGVIIYFLYLKATHQDVATEGPPVPTRRMDPRELTFGVDLPYRRAFELSTLSFGSLPEGEVRSADLEKGILEGWLPGGMLYDMGPAKVTITIRKTGATTSHVHIHAVTPHPTHQAGPRLIDYFFSRNERYVNWIRDFIVDPSKQGDGTILADEDG